MLERGSVRVQEMREALGRMVFVFGALVWDRPFVAPLFSYVNIHPDHAAPRLPLYAVMVWKWIREKIGQRRSHPSLTSRVNIGTGMRVAQREPALALGAGTSGPP